MAESRHDEFRKKTTEDKFEFLYAWCEQNETRMNQIVRELRGLNDRLKKLEPDNEHKSG
jgi:hypothetical protein